MLRASEPIEVVFSDVNMPGMDGIGLAQWTEKPYDLDTLGPLIKTLL